MSTRELIENIRANGFSDAEIAAALGVSTRAVNNWHNGSFQPRAEKLLKLKEMSKFLISKTQATNEQWQGVPIFDTEVTGGLLSLVRDERPEPIYYLPIPGFKDCQFGARVSGDSMYPEIRNGDFVICKEVSEFIYGDIYLIITEDDQETVKHVYPNENTNFINLVPSNKEMPITPISKSKIKKFYKVKGVIKGY